MDIKNLNPWFFALLYSSLLLLAFQSCNEQKQEVRPLTFEQEQKKAVKIAYDTAVKVYGRMQIATELPLFAELKNDSVWIVEGTVPLGLHGGTVSVEILRKKMKVIKVTHYR